MCCGRHCTHMLVSSHESVHRPSYRSRASHGCSSDAHYTVAAHECYTKFSSHCLHHLDMQNTFEQSTSCPKMLGTCLTSMLTCQNPSPVRLTVADAVENAQDTMHQGPVCPEQRADLWPSKLGAMTFKTCMSCFCSHRALLVRLHLLHSHERHASRDR